MSNLSRLDLNLLVTLDALLAENNVTRAARRLNLSQPAVSLQLARLREALGDPLLLPGPRGMRPTARAESLREPLRAALQALRHAVDGGAGFDPAAATQRWHIAASDYTQMTVLLPIIPLLRREAPLTSLAVLPKLPGQLGRSAESGEIDLALHVADEAPPGMRRRLLFDERYVLAGRHDHPALRRRPSLAQFCRLDHLVVSPEGGGFSAATDQALSRQGLSRRVVLSVPNFATAAAVLATTDIVAMLPARLMAHVTGLRAVEPPLAIDGFTMSMLWHERVHRDPAHAWLRERIAGAYGAGAQA